MTGPPRAACAARFFFLALRRTGAVDRRRRLMYNNAYAAGPERPGAGRRPNALS